MSEDTKECPICGETIKLSAKKCRFCGENLSNFQKREEALEEKILYEGNIPLFYNILQVITIIFLFILSGAIAFVFYNELSLIYALLLFITPGLIYLFKRWWTKISTKYTITNQRLNIKQGVFSIGGENIELFRIDDFGLNQPLAMRLMKYSYLLFITTDRSSPDVEVIIPNEIVSISEEIREFILIQREIRGVLSIAGN